MPPVNTPFKDAKQARPLEVFASLEGVVTGGVIGEVDCSLINFNTSKLLLYFNTQCLIGLCRFFNGALNSSMLCVALLFCMLLHLPCARDFPVMIACVLWRNCCIVGLSLRLPLALCLLKNSSKSSWQNRSLYKNWAPCSFKSSGTISVKERTRK